MKQTGIESADSAPQQIAAYALPAEGEGLITMAFFGLVLGVGESTVWQWAKEDPAFPPLIRRGARFTRLRISDCRQYLAGLSTAPAKPSPRTPKGKQ